MHLSLNRVLQTSLTDYSLLNNTNRYCIRQIYYCQICWLRNGSAKDSGPPEFDAVCMVVGFSTIRKITFKDKAVLSCLTPEDADITFLRNAGNHTLTPQCQISNWILILPDSNIKSGAFSAEDCTAWRVTNLKKSLALTKITNCNVKWYSTRLILNETWTKYAYTFVSSYDLIERRRIVKQRK